VKTASAALKAFIPLRRRYFDADRWTITPAGGSALRYTTADRDILYSGNTFSAGGPFVSRTQIKWATGLTVDALEVELDVLPTHLYLGTPLLQAIAAGLLDGARVQLERLIMPSFGDTSLGSVILFAGNVADVVELGRTHAKLQIRSRLELLNNPLPRNLFQPSCRWTLFDSGCTLTKASFGTATTCQAGSTALLLNCGLVQATAYFDMGTITFTSGPNNGVSATVKKYTNGSPSTVLLNVPLPNVPGTGDAFTAVPIETWGLGDPPAGVLGADPRCGAPAWPCGCGVAARLFGCNR